MADNNNNNYYKMFSWYRDKNQLGLVGPGYPSTKNIVPLNDYSIAEQQEYYPENATKAILFVHGWLGTPHTWSDFMWRLRQQEDVAFLAPRLPGHGNSTNFDETYNFDHENWYAEVELAYKTLTDKYDNVTVVGHSLGGALSVRLAAQYAVEKLVLIAPAVYLKPENIKTANRFLPILKMLPCICMLTEGGNLENGRAELTYGVYNWKQIDSLIKASYAAQSTLSNIPSDTKLLMFTGDKDKALNQDGFEDLFANLPPTDKRWEKFEKVGHVPQKDYSSNQVYSEILSFVTTGQT